MSQKNPQIVFATSGLKEVAWEQYDKEYGKCSIQVSQTPFIPHE
jgi:hypothetical protein